MKSFECPLQHQSRLRPQQPFLITPHQTINYAEFEKNVSQIQNYLHFLKKKPSTRVALYAHPSIDSLALLYALWRKGVVVCILNMRLPNATIVQQLKSIRCSYLFTENVLPLTTEPSIKSILIRNILSEKHAQPIKSQTFQFNENQPTTILFTSGSTSTPKAAVLTFGNFYFNAKGANRNLPFKPNDRWLLSLPIFHVSGLGILLRALLNGGSIVLNPRKPLIDSINQFQITHISLVPTQLEQLLKEAQNIKHVRNMKAILMGGSAIPENLIKQSIQHKLPLYITYGLTEMASQVATSSKIKTPQDALKVKVLQFRELRINTQHEILVKGKVLFKGYATASTIKRPFTKQGWFPTGDLGEIHQKKYLRILGRKDNMFISGGENIQPEEIEKALLRIHGIRQAVVIGYPHPRFGMRPAAFIDYKEGTRPINSKRIINVLSKHLPKYKIPDLFLAWPKTRKTDLKPSRREFAQHLKKSKQLF
jgi:O-succinylbenzoic acid--CoA ligase